MSVEKHTAVVSGAGILSPIGNSLDEVLQNLKSLSDGIGPCTKLDTSAFASHLAGEVRNFDPAAFMSPSELETFSDPFLRLAICAARAALRDAKIDSLSPDDAVVVATCNAGMNSQEAEYKALLGVEPEFTRRELLQGEFYAVSRALSCALGARGPCFVINTACSGSTAALAIAQMMVNQGRCKRVIAGGADALALANYAGFSALKVVSPQKTAPFSEPVGMNIGEGAAFWVVEDAETARARGAKILAKIIGYATTGDAHHPTQPDPRGDGAYRTMRGAAACAGVELSDIGCINAHGSGTSANDKAETKAIAKFAAGKIPFTSTKSYTGHCMGATGIIEATCQLAAMLGDFIPPTLRFGAARQGCEAEPVGDSGLNGAYGCFLSANYAFAGNNAAVVVAKESFEKYSTKPAKAERVAITGCGMVSALGIGVEDTLRALRQGVSGLSRQAVFDTGRRAGVVELPPLRSLSRRVDFSGMNRISSFASIACMQALERAQMRVSRANAERVGIIGAISRGASQQAHMLSVYSDPMRRGDISCFSNATPNSTAGWVSKALEIKGANITFTSGLNSSIQALEYAQMLFNGGDADAITVFSADEITPQQLKTYYRLGLLRDGQFEENFKMKYYSAYKTVLGEGACAMLLEPLSAAKARGARVLGEVAACASAIDGGDFYDANYNPDGLRRAVSMAIERAGISASDIGAISWSPRGTSQDSKIVNLRDSFFGKIPMLTSVFHTGYIETASALHSLACVLEAIADGGGLWRQRFGIENFDEVDAARGARYILSLGSSHSGGDYAVIVNL